MTCLPNSHLRSFWLATPREIKLTGRVASNAKTIRESTRNLVGKPEETKPCRKYVSAGKREIRKCILKNGV
jgi:hypothetical protein